MATMFRGQFTHSIDAKGRTSLPSRFRDQLVQSAESRLVLTPALFDPCIHVFPYRAWEEFEARVASMPQFDPNVVRLRRLYVSAAVDCDLDKQGRVLVPRQSARTRCAHPGGRVGRRRKQSRALGKRSTGPTPPR